MNQYLHENNACSGSNNTLQALDINVQSFLEGKNFFLPLPVKPIRSENKQQTLGWKHGGITEITTPLNYNELQKRLRNVLMHIDLFCDGNAEERRQYLQEEFSFLIQATCEETKQMLTPILNTSSLASRVLGVLHYRRRFLCTGFELCLNDLKEWILLALLINEPDISTYVYKYAQKLGPKLKENVGNIIFLHNKCIKSLCNSLLELKAPGEKYIPFESHYYNLILDDLITMGDESIYISLIPSIQTEITLQLRELHAEWLFQISMALNLQLETFFLAVSIVDRYLSYVHVERERLHLIGCASLLLASKQEEIYPISLNMLVRYGGERFTTEILVSMECQILSLLDFNVVIPTFSSIGNGLLLLQQDPIPCESQRCYLMYILASLAIRTYYKQYKISSLVATAVYMSRICFHIPTGQPCEEVLTLLPIVKAVLCRNPALGAGGVYDIFGRNAYHGVSRLKLPEFMCEQGGK